MTEPLPADMFDELCPTNLLPLRFADKWAPLILHCLEHGPRRYSELRVPLRRVTPKMLTRSLRALERDGLISRTVRPGPAPRVEYALTPLGRGALDLFQTVTAWTAQHEDEILDAREAYDAAAAARGARPIAG
ncbi:winged helix-turn-helix transcriptional regulator [Streptomyces ipomoeae]|uniref:winged helix-turn-helix transcriptional regulator n=1 Tax=Streptomyces ipomoeae TaxID=103232 RepID=UPI001146C3E1|nr:helix-turn-helix domain-containing protein [Streptomyces ipomoeae]MDX2939629.1 helix-turn-helix domain-containing protein [Streptomyces ipomoeae]TQE31948.1 transcriptional regulator [Streptomyces ipomoeae]